MKKLVFIFCYLLFTLCSHAQERDVNSILDQTLSYRGLTRGDITIPIEFFTAAEKSPTNDARLMLPLVKDMMVNPLRSMTWLDSVSEMGDEDLVELSMKLFSISGTPAFSSENTLMIFNTKDIKNLVNTMEHSFYGNSEKHGNYFLKSLLTKEEKEFLQQNLMSILEESEQDNFVNSDIFAFNESRDSSILVSKKVMDLMNNIFSERKDNIKISLRSLTFSNIKYIHTLYEKIKNKKFLESTIILNNKYVQGDVYYYSDKAGMRIAIGGPGKNIYTGDFDFIIDLGGDDVYNIENNKKDFGGFRCIMDMSGNDFYTTSSNFALAGGLFSSSFIFDKEGDDIYESKGSGNLGAAIGGLGLLYDEKGNDTYKGISFSIGAGCFGVGLLVDREGNDFYIANSYSQGFGMTQGVGAIVDNKGNDSYLVDARSLDIGRYNDHYVSMCQGYGLGLRPFYAGGIGLIIEGEGNDIYNTDIFGQGGGYWYGLGAIVDKSGHDKYNSYQYGQGAGIHLAVGLLKDYDGWDFYQSDGVSQGCGHDFGFGMLWDVKGNDNYSAYSLSQGAGNADGIGILIDESGTDGYLNKHPQTTRGYGNQRREYGSIGVFLDASGEDYYSQPGLDSTLMNSSSWGVFNDFYDKDLPSQVSGDNFKVQVDSSKDTQEKHGITGNYSVADYFMMAKTIEPRFSLWQEYGFRKLIEDSLSSAQYLLTKLGTSDHRETQVMRVLGQKIQKSVADALMNKLSEYIQTKTGMTQPEVSFACYIFGETKNPQGKEILLQLTYDDNYRVRSSAINALGKIDYDKTDRDFINRVVLRLVQLADEKSDKKLYNKDIAFACNNYISDTSMAASFILMHNSYYGARFLAAQSLQKYNENMVLYFLFGDEEEIREKDKLAFQAFLFYSDNISDNMLREIFPYIKSSPVFSDDAVKMNLLELIRLRRGKSSEPGFLDWCDREILELKNGITLKVK